MKYNTKELFQQHPAYKYAEDAVNNKIVANKLVKKVCFNFLDDINHPENNDYFFDYDLADTITTVTGFINMPNGVAVGMTAKDALVGFQWFFIMNALCWKMKKNHNKRRYEKSVLLIARKNGKTFLVGLLFILLLVIEPRFSHFYSVAPDLELSSLIKSEMERQISVSPIVSKHFKTTKQLIECKLTQSQFQPLATSNNRMDGRLANVFVCDEVGALRNRYPIDAMESSQMNITNRTGILISTAYETLNNPMSQEVDNAEKVINGKAKDDTLFALLYKPDNPKEWMTSDEELLKANPLAIDINETFEFLKKQRQHAIDIPERRKNFLTKHMNIFVNGSEVESYLTPDQVNVVQVNDGNIDWYGRDVYLGIDLSISNDNTGVSMSSYDATTGTMYAKSWCFFPKGKEAEKTKIEKVDYQAMVDKGWAFAVGNQIIDYNAVENFILSIEDTYGVNIKGIGYDRYNAAATVNRLSDHDLNMIEVKQNAMGLYPATKFLKELILSKNFEFEENRLLRDNFLNAKMVVDTNLNYFLNKKKASGKIDMVAALVNSIALWCLDIENDDLDSENDGIIVL